MKTLRVRYANWPPFVTAKYGKDSKNSFRGVVPDIYEGMKTFMGDFEYSPEIQPDNTLGNRLANGSFTGMIKATFNNETDISGPFLVSEDRSFGVEFTVPLGFSQMGIMSGMVPTNKGPFLIFGIFTLPVWISLFFSIALVSATTTLVYHTLPASEKRYLPEVFSKYFWEFYISLVGENFGSSDRWFTKHICDSPSFRILQITWFMGPGLVLLYSYQGGILSAFASNKFKPKIASIEDLLEDRSIGVMTYYSYYPQKYFQELNGTRYASIWDRMKDNLVKVPPIQSVEAVPDWMESVADGKSIFTAESYYLKNLVGLRFLKTGKCDIRVSNMDMGATYIGIGFRKEFHNSKILKQFNRGLRRFTEGNLAHLSLLHSDQYYDICNGVSPSPIKPLNLKDLLGAFLVLVTGLTVSLIVFFVEILVNKTFTKTDAMSDSVEYKTHTRRVIFRFLTCRKVTSSS